MNGCLSSINGLAFPYVAGFPPSLRVASSLFISPSCFAVASWPPRHGLSAVKLVGAQSESKHVDPLVCAGIATCLVLGS